MLSVRRNRKKHRGTCLSQQLLDQTRRQSGKTARLSRKLGRPHGVPKWQKQASVDGLKTGSKAPRSTVLTAAEEAMVGPFQRHTRLPLDDCLDGCWQTMANQSPFTLHRLQFMQRVVRFTRRERTIAARDARRARSNAIRRDPRTSTISSTVPNWIASEMQTREKNLGGEITPAG